MSEKGCPICLEYIVNDEERTLCNHFFHKVCIGIWKEKKPECPLCRTTLVQPLEMDYIVEKMRENYIRNYDYRYRHPMLSPPVDGRYHIVNNRWERFDI